MKMTNIINVADNVRPTEKQYNLLDVFYLPAVDSETYDLTTAMKTVAFYIDSSVTSNPNRKILVHCAAGISRSSSMIIGYCMIYKKMSLLESYKFVKLKKSNIAPNPGFMRQLMSMEMEVFNVKESTIDFQWYITGLLQQIFPNKTEKQISTALDNADGDYVAAQNMLFL